MTREEFLKLPIADAWDVHENDQTQIADTLARINQAGTDSDAMLSRAGEATAKAAQSLQAVKDEATANLKALNDSSAQTIENLVSQHAAAAVTAAQLAADQLAQVRANATAAAEQAAEQAATTLAKARSDAAEVLATTQAAAKKAAEDAETAKQAALQVASQQLSDANARAVQTAADTKIASDAALAAKEAERVALQATINDQLATIADLQTVIGDTDGGKIRIKEKQEQTVKARLLAVTQDIDALGLDVAAEVATVVSAIATAKAATIESSPAVPDSPT